MVSFGAADDLESVVRIMHFMVTNDKPKRSGDDEDKMKSSLEFWNYVLENSPFWRNLQQLALEKKYDELIKRKIF